MKKIIAVLVALLSVIAVIVPVALPMAVTAALPQVYSESFVGVLDDKVERLESIEGEKVVVVGGSSVAFGLDSALMEEELGKPVVNFGLYAAIGSVAMMELSKGSIGRGDIVILAPEIDPQALSAYFNSEMILKAIDEDPSLILRFSSDYIMKLLGGLWPHAVDKLTASAGEYTSPKGIYSKDSFDPVYFDIKSGLRKENVMPLYYDPNTPITLSPDIVDSEYIRIVNDYVSYCRLRGAEVYFSYSPMLKDAIVDTTEEDIYEFESYLSEALDCEIISFAETYIMDAGYFYDTNFHLNDVGVEYRTLSLIEDLTGFVYDKPDAPKLPFVDVEFDGYDENEKYFRFEEMANGAYKIVGLSNLGAELDMLIVPLGYNGKKVMAIDKGAFSASPATSLVVTPDTNLRNFFDGCMDGSVITDIWIYYNFENEDDKLVPPSSFGGVTIHFPPGSIYSTHYDWQDSSGGYTYDEDAVE